MESLQTKKGVAALMTVIIVVAMVLSIGVVIAQIGINELVFGLQGDRSDQLLQIADSCADEGYYRLKRDQGYSGGTVTFSEGSCTLTISGSEPNRILTVSATVEELTRDFTINIDAKSNIAANARGIDVTNWLEQ
ncbi:MAG: hypothetical protein ABH826_04090 [Patescibacteria group bacterium]|nr:hypothetical protein [Patescibacteria group bacterium]